MIGKAVKAIGALLFIGILIAAVAIGGQTLVLGLIAACVVGIPTVFSAS